MYGPIQYEKTLRQRLAIKMRRRGWTQSKYDGSLRQRLTNILGDRHPWWDWGHHTMTLVGRYDCGNWSPPRVRDMWFRSGPDGTFIKTRDYNDIYKNNANDGEWRVFDSQDDGHTIVIGWYPGPGGDGYIKHSGLLDRKEQRLFIQWYLWDGWVKAEWFGLRRWAYFKALHAAVERKKPFTCQATPPPDTGGYDHWHCELPKRHKEEHRFMNYTWPHEGQTKFTQGRLTRGH